jgi:predicted small metal-binding protein
VLPKGKKLTRSFAGFPLSCGDFGADCDFMVRAKTAEEAIEHGHAHSCEVHGKCESSDETDERIRSLINNVWL